MIVIVTLGALLAAIGYYVFVVPPIAPVAKDRPGAEAIAAAMLVYQKAAVDWCLRTTCQPASGGVVPAAELYLPVGYAAMPWLVAVADSHSVSTFVTGLAVNPASIALSLGDLTGGGPSAGWTDQRLEIFTPATIAGHPQVVAVPTAIAAGSRVPAVSQRVR